MTAINVDKTCCALPISLQDHRETSLLTDRDVNKILERKFGSGNFRLVCWRLEQPSNVFGFAGQYYRLHITARCAANGEEIQSLQFFAKTPPPPDSPQFKFVTRFDTFNKEIAVYTDVMQRMGMGGSSKWTVESYLCKQDVIIVLEDASLDGYVTPDKYVPFDEEHCDWLLKTLSKFHSRSFILDERLRREENRTIYDFYGHLLIDVLYPEFIADDRATMLASSITGFNALVDLVEDLDNDAKDDIKRRIAVWSQKVSQLFGPSKRHRNIMCHRDIWTNNIMLRYDPTGNINGCYFVDWQFLCYCPPVIDFACCIYQTTTRATWNRYFDSFTKIYHDSLAQYLAEEGLDINDHLPWTAFRESYEDGRNIALFYAALNLQIMLLSEPITAQYLRNDPNKIEQILYNDERAKFIRYQCETIPAFKSRLLDVVLEIKDRLPEHPPNF
ncbi:uncharacterized protein [Anoplolepis gracilipes]|uniref:uncharacterized protein n=1 Tax=Anoplolepis gracilipes TaxID=354296 RepID=UPI003BA230BD